MNLKKNSENFVLSEENIIEYVLNRFENLKKELSKDKLILFHTHNKFFLISHIKTTMIPWKDHSKSKKIPLSECIKDYEKHLKEALSVTTTTKLHINTLIHIFGHFSKDFDQPQKESFLNLLE